MRIEFTHDQHRAVIKLVLAVHLMPDIHAQAAPPDFALLERGRMVLGVQLLFMAVPAWKIPHSIGFSGDEPILSPYACSCNGLPSRCLLCTDSHLHGDETWARPPK